MSKTTYDGEPAMSLEAVARYGYPDVQLPLEISTYRDRSILDTRPVAREIPPGEKARPKHQKHCRLGAGHDRPRNCNDSRRSSRSHWNEVTSDYRGASRITRRFVTTVNEVCNTRELVLFTNTKVPRGTAVFRSAKQFSPLWSKAAATISSCLQRGRATSRSAEHAHVQRPAARANAFLTMTLPLVEMQPTLVFPFISTFPSATIRSMTASGSIVKTFPRCQFPLGGLFPRSVVPSVVVSMAGRFNIVSNKSASALTFPPDGRPVAETKRPFQRSDRPESRREYRDQTAAHSATLFQKMLRPFMKRRCYSAHAFRTRRAVSSAFMICRGPL